MKKLLTLVVVLIGFLTNLQAQSNLELVTDEFTDEQNLHVKKNLLVTDDGKIGFVLYPIFTKEKNIWKFNLIGGTTTVGTCSEKDVIYFIFEDDSKFKMTSFMPFSCKGTLAFDELAWDAGKFIDNLNKSIKAIKIVNGRDFKSFQKVLIDKNDKEYFINIFKELDNFNSK